MKILDLTNEDSKKDLGHLVWMPYEEYLAQQEWEKKVQPEIDKKIAKLLWGIYKDKYEEDV